MIKNYYILLKSLLISVLAACILLIAMLPQRAMATNLVTKAGSGITGNYQLQGKAQGRGSVQVSMVGPGATASGQSYYQAYTYVNGVMDLVAINPDTGTYRVYPSPATSEAGAWSMAVGSDKNMYIGTLPNAHLLKFDTRLSRLIDLGSVPADPKSGVRQSYIWQLTTSPYNGKMYGCTYPSADLVTYNPLSAKPTISNLGTMDPAGQDQYLHYCTADANPRNPYIYLGLGSVTGQIAVYNVDTNKVVERVTSTTAGFGLVYLGNDGNLCASLKNGTNVQWYQLINGTIVAGKYVNPSLMNTFTDNRTITVGSTSITITSPDHSIKTYPFLYAGQSLMIFRMGLGPDQKIYGGTALPYNFFSFDPASATSGITMMGQVGYGEPYSMQTLNKKLYIASYYSPSLGVYDPTQPFDPKMNPITVPPRDVPTDLRSQALIAAPNNHLYIGAIASYGQLTGQLISWDVQNSNNIVQYYPIQNQGVSSLTVAAQSCVGRPGNLCLVGGSTIYGGGGSTPVASSAVLFSWDTTTNTVIQRYALPNVSAVNTITDLITNPSNGYVYGIAQASSGTYAFVFNPATGKFINGGTLLPFSGAVYNSAILYQGKIWGLSPQGVFAINTTDVRQATLIKSPQAITAGFVLRGKTLYFASNSNLWSYNLA